jgi:hypothetical protein
MEREVALILHLREIRIFSLELHLPEHTSSQLLSFMQVFFPSLIDLNICWTRVGLLHSLPVCYPVVLTKPFGQNSTPFQFSTLRPLDLHILSLTISVFVLNSVRPSPRSPTLNSMHTNLVLIKRTDAITNWTLAYSPILRYISLGI